MKVWKDNYFKDKTRKDFPELIGYSNDDLEILAKKLLAIEGNLLILPSNNFNS